MTLTKTKPTSAKKFQVPKPAPLMFNIRRRMWEMTNDEKSKMKDFVKRESVFSTSAIANVIYIKQDATRVPNYIILKAFAKYFDCSIEELENEKNG